MKSARIGVSKLRRPQKTILFLLVVALAGTGLLASLVSARPSDPSREDGRISIVVSAFDESPACVGDGGRQRNLAACDGFVLRPS